MPEGFDYVYENLKRDLCLSSISGGTDIIACFVGGNPALPGGGISGYKLLVSLKTEGQVKALLKTSGSVITTITYMRPYKLCY